MYRIVKVKNSKDKSFSNTMFCSQWECTKSLSTENVNELKGQFPSLKRTLLGKMPRIKMPSGVYFCCLQISFSCIQTLKKLSTAEFSMTFNATFELLTKKGDKNCKTTITTKWTPEKSLFIKSTLIENL